MKYVLLIALAFILRQTPAFSEITAKFIMDTNKGKASIIFYQGEKEIAKKHFLGENKFETKGKIPDGPVKLYNDDILIGIIPFTNGKMNGEAVMYEDGTERKTVFRDDEEVLKDWHIKKKGNVVNIYYDSGTLRQTDTLFPDGRVKTSKSYGENGKLLRVNNYDRFFNLDGAQKYYNDSGILVLSADFKNGIGKVKTFYDNGKLFETFQAISNDVYFRNGPAKRYDESGRLTEEMNYVTNVMIGTNIEYLDGGYRIVQIYEDWGCRSLKEYDGNNELIREADNTMSDGVYYGQSCDYEGGSLVREESTSNSYRLWGKVYKDGVKIGETRYSSEWNGDYQEKIFYDDGVLFKEYSLKKWRLSGVYREYYPNSQLKEECSYVNGSKDGLDRTYSESGGIKSIDTYKNGYKINSKKYDDQEKLVVNQDYPYNPEMNPENALPDISDTLRTAFYNTRKFTVLERTRIKSVLQEQAFQLAGFTTSEDAVKLGNILNVNYIALGSITKIGGDFVINVRVVSVENSEIVAAETAKCGSVKQLISVIDDLAVKITEKIPQAKPGDHKRTMAVLDIDSK